MKVFTCIDHDVHYPVGGASVVVAESETSARKLLYCALKLSGLEANNPFTLKELNIEVPAAYILRDGEY